MPPTDKLTDSLIRNAKAGLNPLQKAESKKQASGVRGGRPSASVIDNEIPPKKKPYPAHANPIGLGQRK